MASSTDFRMLDKDSVDIKSHELEIFEEVGVNTSIREAEIDEIPPDVHPHGTAPCTFEVTGSKTHYYDLKNSLLQLQVEILKADGTKLDNDPTKVTITPSQQLFHSLISRLTIYMNHKLIEDNMNYAYKAYLQSVLNHGGEAKKSHLANVKWIDDGLLEEHSEKMTAPETAIFKARAAMLAGSKTLDMIGRPCSALFSQQKLILPGTQMKFEIQFHTPEFALQQFADDEGAYKINIINASLLLRKVQVHPTIALEHAKILQKKHAKYPLTKTDVKFFTISPGRASENINIISNNQEAKVLIIGLVDHTARNGAYKLSPFKFEPHNLSSINVKANGNYVYKQPLKMDYGQDIYMRVFNNLQSVCGKTFTDQGNGISPAAFKKCLCLYAFDLTPDGCHGDGTHLQRISDTTLELNFSQALTDTTSVMVYYEFDEVLSIDQFRNPYLASSS